MTRKTRTTSPVYEDVATGWLQPCLLPSLLRRQSRILCPRRWSSRNLTSYRHKNTAAIEPRIVATKPSRMCGSCCPFYWRSLPRSPLACVR